MEGFSQMEVSVIRNMMHSRSFKDIAAVLDRTKQEIAECVAYIIDGTDIIPFQTSQDQRLKQNKPVKVKLPKQKPASGKKITKADLERIEREKRKEQKKVNQQERLRVDHERAKARAEARGKYVTREVDYTKLRTVKVCKGTFVYAKPGESDQQVIDRYNSIHKKNVL
jgi:hypothetical protein